MNTLITLVQVLITGNFLMSTICAEMFVNRIDELSDSAVDLNI